MRALRAYQLTAFLAAPYISLSLRRRAQAGREDATRLKERKGIASQPRPDGKLIWFHAASVGETYSVLPLIKDILAANQNLSILLTTGTYSSAQIIAGLQNKPDNSGLSRLIHQYAPLDRRAWITRFLNHWRPTMAGWVESEIWPNWVLACEAQRIDLIMINGRLSARSYERWQRIAGTARHLLSRFKLIMAQDQTTAARLIQIGSKDITTPGNLKLDAPALSADTAELASLQAQFGDRPLWLASSTHEGEETQILAAHKLLRAHYPNLLTLIAPRHPVRGDGLATQLQAGLPDGYVAQRSRGGTVTAQTEIYLLDTLGELGIFYRLANIVFMGGSLVPHGGQNPVEAARLDCALLHGPHVANFAEIFADLRANGAAHEISDSATLSATLIALLGAPAQQQELAANARAYAQSMHGARQRVQDLLRPYWEAEDA